MLNIFNDIIDFSKIQAGQISACEEEVPVNDILLDVVTFHKPIAKRTNIDLYLKKALSGSKSIVITDGSKLRQIINNLVGNAIKFTFKGFVEIGYTLKESFLEFYVKDTGVGITPENQIKILDRFYQEDLSITTKQRGTGLGPIPAETTYDGVDLR